jgi:hypothetical protein
VVAITGEYARLVRALAVALLAIAAVALPAASAGGDAKIAYVLGERATIVYLGSPLRQPIVLTKSGPPRWSGDGRLLSIGGWIVGRARLSATQLAWAPTGETAAYSMKDGAVMLWTPKGSRTVVDAKWGATTFAWGPNGKLALGRSVCHVPCGVPLHQEVWIWRNGSLQKVAGPLSGVQRPIVAGFAPDGRVLWWPDEQGSGSIAADGLPLYANRNKIVTTLVFADFVVRCGRHLAVVAGGDRYTTHGKRLLFDGRNVSDDTTRSWVSPSCTANGRLVAAAGRNWEENRFGAEHRAIWQLLPTRRQLTRPPSGWTDESPHLLTDGSVLFIRTHQTARKRNGEWITTNCGLLERMARGKLTRIADVSFAATDASGNWLNYYGHYNWPDRIAVTP